MDPVTLLLAAGLLLITVLFLFRGNEKQAEIAKKINKLPGPKVYPLFGSTLPFLFLNRNEVFAYGQQNLKTYKTLFRSWTGKMPVIHMQCPEDVESSEYIDKGFVYKFLHRWLGTGLLTSTGQKWHTHRKMITPTFHFKILDHFIEVFSEKSEILINKLQKEVGNKGFDVYPYITKCALDIICETAMGTPIYAQDDRGAEYVNAVYDMSEITVKRMFRPWLHPEFTFKLSKMGRRTDQCLKILHGFTNKVIAERKALLQSEGGKSPSTSTDEDSFLGKKKRKAFLDLLLEVDLGGVKLTDEELREEGHDTTSAGMCWALFLLGLHPEIQEKAYEEQENIFQGSDRSATMKDLNEMKYLERVIKETLRIYPSVPTISRKLNTDVKIGEYDIPSGTTVTMHIYNVHRNPTQFPDPEKFNPDNFLPENVAKRHPYAYIPFSAGPRNCIGQKFAILEEKTVLSYILRYYKIKSLDKRDNINLMGELILRPEKGINVTLTSRKGTTNNF
ncbi:Cytochrome P450 4C1 [Blattella germanica]|nr:Cytochrome P450 4C1 [Blattella germanica]